MNILRTINIKGLIKSGAREEIEQCMKDMDIMIVALQQTNIGNNSKEVRGEYT